jgi:Sec34-like family
MAYLSSQPHFKDSQVYVVKFGQLQSRALALVKNQVIEYLDQVSTRMFTHLSSLMLLVLVLVLLLV